MNEIKINFENCYGIKELNQTFSFKKSKAHVIYAPNGTIKTSFAKTMHFVSGQTKEKPCDRLSEEKKSCYDVSIDDSKVRAGKENRIFVVNAEEKIDSSEAFVNFLASSKLRDEYENITKKLLEAKEPFISKLRGTSQSTDCETEIIDTFRNDDDKSSYAIWERIYDQANDYKGQKYDFKYNDIFDKKGVVKEFIEKHKEKLKKYVKIYNELLSKSKLYRSINGFSFGTYQANQINKAVSDGHFFGVDHKIVLHNGEEIKQHEELEELIEKEQTKILEDESLKKTFDDITKAIDRNAELREFKKIIEAHPEWIEELLHYDVFHKKVWLGFLTDEEVKPLFDSFMKLYKANKEKIERILSEAEKEQESWKNIIELYNARFHVPFKVEIVNQKDIILNQSAAKLKFSYITGENSYEKEENELINILSKGEKRAFVILQFLFEVEARKLAEHETLIVMDDIADSFDYQNKYAIIEYIKDLIEDKNDKFYLLILTHNYDFYRTVALRLNIHYENLWMVDKAFNGTITINSGQYTGNIFTNVFIKNTDNPKIFLSMIPFVRNLVEYTEGTDSEKYETLTKCLHIKKGTEEITSGEIRNILSGFTGKEKTENPFDDDSCIFDNLMKTAKEISEEEYINPVLIENKIVLSMAIRLIAEGYMYYKLSESEVKDQLDVTSNQTGKWMGLYKKHFAEDENITTLEKVNMMTPECIHLNSFMYEPLIDMSVSHLVDLYKTVIACKEDS